MNNIFKVSRYSGSLKGLLETPTDIHLDLAEAYYTADFYSYRNRSAIFFIINEENGDIEDVFHFTSDIKRKAVNNMTLYDLLQFTNDSTIITLFRAEDGCEIGAYDGKDQIDWDLTDYEVTDIFVDGGRLCIELETEGDDYDEE